MATANSTPDLPEIPQKQCTKCQEWFPATAEYFYPRKDQSERLRRECRQCQNAQSRKSYSANRDKRLQYRRDYCERERAQIVARRRARYNPERASARHRAWRKAHPEYFRAYQQAYYQEHTEAIRAYGQQYYAANSASIREKRREYKATHPDVIRAAHQRRRARKQHAPVNDFTAAQWQAMKAHYGYRCVYCGKKSQRLTMDHLTPLSQGGAHTAANIAPACQTCNSRKNARAVLRPVQPVLLL